MQVIDQRTDNVFHVRIANLKKVNIKLVNIDDPVGWLSQALEKEFAARDVPIKITQTRSQAPADLTLTVRNFQISSRRYSGFSPWDTYDSFVGDLSVGGRNYDIRACTMNGKVPVFSMSEVEEPCFNLPLSILVKEIVSKINRSVLHYSVSDEKLKEIQGRVEAGAKSSQVTPGYYPPVIDLGGVNNFNAVKSLVAFVGSNDHLTRAYALSAIGTLGDPNQLDFLKHQYEACDGVYKYMALKSIGDFGIPEAQDFLNKVKADPQYNKKVGLKFAVDLYLQK